MLLPKSFQFALAIVGISVVVGASACNLSGNNTSVSQSNIAQPQGRPTRDPNAVKYFESVEEINRSKAAFAEKIGGEIKITKMRIYEDYSEIQAQNPQKPENVDRYTYRNGALEKVVPVQIIGSGNLEDNLFKLNDVAIEKIPELVREAMERSKDLENPKILVVQIVLSTTGIPQILVNVNSTRKNAMMTCDFKGNIISYQ